MFIKKLTIKGFKSFADKTSIEFKKGINIILGPNGCGKSNIIDAIRWVLGEKRLKTLRASKSEDIIFGGSQERSAANYAEVSFLLNNEPKMINSEFPEVLVSRKLFRSGDAVYSTNKQECRLKDIHELFLDTGLGKGSYSIIQQGQIDQILSSRPEERRALFEEAAGIARSKLLVKESKSKLAKTEENLERLADILLEVKHQMDTLKEQAEKALEYKNLKNFIDLSDKRIFYARYAKILKKISDSDHKGKAFEEKVKSLKDQMQNKYSEIDDVISQINLTEEKLEQFRDDEKELEMKEYKLNEQIKIFRNEHERLKKSHEKAKEKQEQLLEKKQSQQSLMQNWADEERDLEDQALEFEERQEELSSQLIQLEENIHSTATKINDLRSENQSLNKEISVILEKQKKVFQELVHSLETKKGEISRTLQEKNKYKDQIGKELTRIDGFFKKWNFSLENQSEELLTSNKILDELKELSHNMNDFKNHFKNYESSVQEILDFFEKDAGLVFNEEYEFKIQSSRSTLESNNDEIFDLEEELEQKRKSRDTIIRVRSENEIQLNKIREKQINLLSEREKLSKEIASTELEIHSFSEELSELEIEMSDIEEEVFQSVDQYEKIRVEKQILDKEKSVQRDFVMEKTKELQALEEEQKQISEEMERLSLRMEKIIMEHKENLIKRDMIENVYFDKYGENIQNSFEPEKLEKIDENQMEVEIREAKRKLENIGAVNLLAIDEYEEVKERYEFQEQNRLDMQQAKEDLEKLINEVQDQSTQQFLEIFEKIHKNFTLVFKKAFNGGKCKLELADPLLPLESGIDIIVQPPGKKLQSIALLSGGERTMVALSLMFSIFMVKPSPFCLMDEVDAALDELNIERFLNIVNEFSDQTQFIIITHNRITAQRGNTFYGVTMQEAGITKVFSFKPDNHNNENIA